MIDRNFLIHEFPEFEWIKDVQLREKCIDVMVEAFQIGGWDEKTAGKCPIAVTEMVPECPVRNFDHIHDVAQVAKMITDYIVPKYKKYINCNVDIVIAAALIHDACKYTEYKLVEGKPAYTESAKYLRHPLRGAILAAKHGLPDALIHAIATHSFEGDKSYKSPEAYILKLADAASFGYLALKFHS